MGNTGHGYPPHLPGRTAAASICRKLSSASWRRRRSLVECRSARTSAATRSRLFARVRPNWLLPMRPRRGRERHRAMGVRRKAEPIGRAVLRLPVRAIGVKIGRVARRVGLAGPVLAIWRRALVVAASGSDPADSLTSRWVAHVPRCRTAPPPAARPRRSDRADGQTTNRPTDASVTDARGLGLE